MSNFRKGLEILINSNSKENGSNTPDFLLAEYLGDCLETFDKIVNKREDWFGRTGSKVITPWNNSGVEYSGEVSKLG